MFTYIVFNQNKISSGKKKSFLFLGRNQDKFYLLKKNDVIPEYWFNMSEKLVVLEKGFRTKLKYQCTLATVPKVVSTSSNTRRCSTLVLLQPSAAHHEAFHKASQV